MKSAMRSITGWLRRRVRMYVRKQWKGVRTRFMKLKSLGVPAQKSWEWANTRKGYRRTAGGWIMAATLANEYLVSLGVCGRSNAYEKRTALKLSNRRIRGRMYGGVRGGLPIKGRPPAQFRGLPDKNYFSQIKTLSVVPVGSKSVPSALKSPAVNAICFNLWLMLGSLADMLPALLL